MLLAYGTNRHQRFQKQISVLTSHNTGGTKISEIMALMLCSLLLDTIFFKNNA